MVRNLLDRAWSASCLADHGAQALIENGANKAVHPDAKWSCEHRQILPAKPPLALCVSGPKPPFADIAMNVRSERPWPMHAASDRKAPIADLGGILL